ncbi:MAG: Cysteine desulfurase [candidate division WS6 bacterium GW2011_GWF2_33_92]|nr:MAG: SufS subfamily cysteine desulfurase, cysteine desulfurase / selenocysteine lyase [candidate division WS6 bacterium GW2011_GWF1_33_233]KKP54706.1 MAG: SufS subfamily cysteine desulfurase, cysteine desulfurase / selenocysteine lyase [candidate division WS6 bacterium GW2011_WS6_33_547]KKP56726.1 MAG: Cysteine desulfurase [candidate division WS6 bacterium GW2011_GWF2_33_92]HBB64959.1 cysteine desulfurase [Patescibacteria group bacterium]
MFEDIRKEFPILKNSLFGKKFVYLDNAATTQKPQSVIDRFTQYYSKENANIHRGPYELSINATQLWEQAHESVASFINADSYKEIIFVRNSTEGLNFLVNTFGRELLSDGDIVVISEMEHHSNIVSWMLLQKQINFKLKYIPVKDDLTLDIDWLKDLVKKNGKKVKIVSVVHISNVLGIKNDVEEIFKIAKSVDAFTILDAAQSIARCEVNVKKIGCDALVFSGHKVYGPTGSGAIYCKLEYLEKLTPWMGGGEMISKVSKDGLEYNDLPWKFEAGTPDIGGGIVLGSAIEWLKNTVENVGGWDVIINHEQGLIGYLLNQFNGIEWFKHFGPNDISLKYGVVAFNIEGFTFRGCKNVLNIETSRDGNGISEFLNISGVAFREGYHCAEPLHDKFCIGPTLRFSLGIYNNEEDIKYATNILKQAVLRGLS